ncbi:MAG: proton-conducting transporter membrane subunit [Acidimicrobiales bacterium]|jgi:formate hydrogenlyase subunit 3/multisubunit Na+/H+ antiporter MnhD subunit
MTGVLLVVALLLFALGATLDLVRGSGAAWARVVPFVAGMAGGGLLAAAGLLAVYHPEGVVSLGAMLGVGRTSLRLDPLAGLFLTLTGGLASALSACLVGWSRPEGRISGRGTAAGYLLLLGTVTVIIVAGDAFTFLFGWEGLTIALYVLAGVRRADRANARASWATLGMGKMSGGALLLAFLLLAGRSGSLTLATWSQVPGGALRAGAFALLVVGFGAKVGLLPFQVWVPIGYPAAPGPIRAAMAGLAANVGFYGLWRFLGILGRPPIWLAVTVLVLGGLTALVGICFAAVQSRLNRAIAFSSVENAGMILVGYGVALAGATSANPEIIAVGLLAASLQVVAHAVAKSGLYASGAFITANNGSDDLETLRGAGRRAPVSGAAFALGSLTLAGLPPTIGFVSEWFLLEALLQEFRLHELALRLAMATAGALVALTTGVAAFAFVRLIGFAVLGRPAVSGADKSDDGGPVGRAGLVLLGLACIAPSALAPVLVRFLARGLAPVVPASFSAQALKAPWVLQPVFSGFSILSPSWLLVELPIAVVVVGLVASVLSGGRFLRIRRVPAWRSATPGVAGPDRYSAFGYANVLRHVLGNVLGASHTAEAVEPGGDNSPDESRTGTRLQVIMNVVEPAEAYIYRPALAAWLLLSRIAKKLQSGRLDAYIAYMLVALLAVLAAVAALH